MTILKAEILTHLNSELNRSETDIDGHILSAMKYLSLSDDFIWVESIVSTIAGRTYYSLPLDYRKLMTINFPDEKPLEKINWRRYKNLIASRGDESSRDKPEGFALHGGYWYPIPIPDAVYTATLHYNAYIPESEEGVNAVEAIDDYFTDIFRDALNTLAKAYYCLSKQLKDEAGAYFTIFTNIDLPPLKKMVEREPKNLPYNDLM